MSGAESLLRLLTTPVTAHSCGRVRSLAKASRWAAVHSWAPESHAFFSGTMWSICRSEAESHVAPSYGEYHEPETERQAESVSTSVPSRFRTVSLHGGVSTVGGKQSYNWDVVRTYRVLQEPEMVIQCLNLLRL